MLSQRLTEPATFSRPMHTRNPAHPGLHAPCPLQTPHHVPPTGPWVHAIPHPHRALGCPSITLTTKEEVGVKGTSHSPRVLATISSLSAKVYIGHGDRLQCSCLGNPMDKEAW